MTRFRQFAALAGLTAVEAIRQPICLLLTTACVVLTALVPLLSVHNFGEDGKLARDSGLAFHFIFGLFVAGYAASASLAREIRTGTASAVLSKPVDREVFYLAKFAGVVGVVLAFSACATIATLLGERVSEKFVMAEAVGYFTDWQTGFLLLGAPALAFAIGGFLNHRLRLPFQSTAYGLLLACVLLAAFAAGWFDRMGAPVHSFNMLLEWRILPASLLVTIALVVLAAVALALSTRLSTVPTLALSAGVLISGLMTDYLLGRRAAGSWLADAAYHVLPNWQHFWLSDALANGGTIPSSYLAGAALYALAYGAAVVCIGLVSFRHVEMK